VIPVVLSHNADIVILTYMLAQNYFFYAEKAETCVFDGNCSKHGCICCSVHLTSIVLLIKNPLSDVHFNCLDHSSISA